MTKQAAIVLVLMVLLKISDTEMSKEIPTRPDVISIGALFSFNSTIGQVAKVAIAAAVDDVNSSPQVLNETKLKVSMQDANHNGFLGMIKALRLMENDIMAIIGPEFSVSAHTISQVATELQVPLLSFAATEPTLSSLEFPYFVRTTQSDLFQMSAIADILDYYEWTDVIAIYVEDDYGRNGVAVLGDKLAEKRRRIFYKASLSPNMSRLDIIHVLSKLASIESMVLILHTYPDLGLEVLDVAKDLGMMRAGYVWITTDWLSTVLDANSDLAKKAIDGIEGVLTLRIYTQDSEMKRKLISRWEGLTDGKSASGSVGLNTYGLYAYDTVWLLAQAIDELLIQGTHISFSTDSKLTQLNGKSWSFDSVKIFNEGNLLLKSILKVNLTGVTGKMMCNSDGCVVNPAYEVINVIGSGLRKIGYWSNYSGLSVLPPENHHAKPNDTSSSKQQLHGVVWPGQTTEKPRGWVYPNDGKPLRIAVTKPFFKEIIFQVEGTSAYSGFCIDVFNAAVDLLPYTFPYQFVPSTHHQHQPNNTELMYMVQRGVYDAAVGGIAVTTSRMRMVDFTQPFVESGLVVVAPIRKLNLSTWAFLRPFTPMLWCVTGLSFLIVGVVIWILEHRRNDDFRGPPRKQVITILLFSFSTLFPSQREKTVTNLSRFLLIIWLSVVLILNSTYTASLSSILTVERLSSNIKGIESLLSSNHPIGYQIGSFAGNYLANELNIHHSRIVPLNSPEEYEKALINGPEKGGVAALVSERVTMEIFLSTRCEFSIVGQDLMKIGWAFAFKRDSPLAVDMSAAIIKLSECGELQRIRDKWLKQSACIKEDGKKELDRLPLKNFLCLFLICGSVGLLVLLVYLTQMVNKFIKHNSDKSQSSTLRSWSAALSSFASFLNEKEELIQSKPMGRQMERSSVER
ncbi:hypothetical protein L6164_003068 [Bauhinia variegata]|uniref:Uncharacterized protein n=1 Tax=Bauhinia variegata TaxID=167791 RepID=A0ACB9PZN5_BAUVA|nr:hypothetical protein L6164_003068 [Bauhinia variegata]